MKLDRIRATATEYIKENKLSILTLGKTPNPKNPGEYLEQKRPALIQWEPLQKAPIENPEDLFTGKLVNSKLPIYGLGVITGAVNGNLEVIDVDTKYDIKGGIWEDLKKGMEDTLPHLLEQFLIVQTVSGGYHIYYRCETIAGNQVFAIREATPEEKLEKAKEKIKPLIETRGEGGYVVAPPTPNYKSIQGSYSSIPDITTEERDTLFSICKSLTQYVKPQPTATLSTYSTTISNSEDSPFIAYNQEGASVVIPLLVSHDWTEVERNGDRIKVKRPGESTAHSSGDFHIGKNLLKVFSSSTDFEPEKGYSPSSVFCILECSGDWKLAYRKLLEQGYGKPIKGDRVSLSLLQTEGISVNAVNNVNSKPITAPGEILTKEALTESLGDIYISSPTGSREETLKAIAIAEETGKKIYIVRDGGKILKTYEYKLEETFSKYIEIQADREELTAPEKDQFIEELLTIASRLKGIDRDLYTKRLSETEYIQELGLTPETMEEAIEKIRDTEKTQELHKKTGELTRKAQELLDQNKPEEALKLIQETTTKLSKLRTKDFVSEILRATSREDILEEIKNSPEGLKSGYFVGKIKNGNLIYSEEWLITAGGLTAIAGATNHGKTDFLINTCLNVSKNYPEKKFIYLTYEQSRRDIFLRFCNSFCEVDITSGGGNVRAIKKYHRYGTIEKPTALKEYLDKESEFYTDYIDSGRLIVKQVDYNSDEINGTIEQLCKQDSSIGGFFIDYYQKLELPKENKKQENRVEELKEIGKKLNKLSIDTGIPIVLGAQFNRKVMSPEDMFAQNIGEAGDIERILDTLIAIWNTSKKLRKHEKEEALSLEDRGIARLQGTREYNGKTEIKKLVRIPENLYIEVLKSRDTETGLEALLSYNGKLGSIKNQQEKKQKF
jgi:replicative DNA helicase